MTGRRPVRVPAAVAHIAQHAGITIEIAYLETLPLRNGHYGLHLPLAITPRYTPRERWRRASGRWPPVPRVRELLFDRACHVAGDLDVHAGGDPPGFACGIFR